jgi:SAM-dependent methyltransferase
MSPIPSEIKLLFLRFPIDITAQIRMHKYLKIRDAVVLDAGCGRGQLPLNLANKNKLVVGVDWSEKNIAELKKIAKCKKINNLRFYHLNLQNLSTMREKFDVIICSQVLEHIKDDITVLKQLREHLVPKGLLYLDVPSSENPGNKVKELIPGGHVRSGYSTEDIPRLERIGFKVEELEYFTHNFFLEIFKFGYLFENLRFRLFGQFFRFIWFLTTFPLIYLDDFLPSGPTKSLAVLFKLRKR